MDLEKCPDCGREVSRNAKTCPHCGGKTRNAHRVEEERISIIAFAILIVPAVLYFFSMVGR